MFTGIVKAKGRIDRIEDRGGDKRFVVVSDGITWRDFEIGESISVNGVCLTAVKLHEHGFATDVSVETLEVSALGEIDTGAAVNLEPSVSLGERLGGHLVSGHVDCVGTIASVRRDARSIRLAVRIPAEFGRYVARKGSVCIDGVSLTVNEVSSDGFDVNIIPHTAEVTIIGGYAEGTRVNIEVDVVARYLERLITADEDSGITKEFLRAHGYA
jgi:riboflavin synthase